MDTNSTPTAVGKVITPPVYPEYVAKIQDENTVITQWQNMGSQFRKEELLLSIVPQSLKKRYPLPQDASKIPEYESGLKDLKEQLADVSGRRKTQTSMLDAYIKRRMTPEKEIEVYIAEYSAGLLQIKKDEHARIEKAANEAKYKETVLANYRTEFNQFCQKIETDITTTSHDLFVRALNAGRHVELTDKLLDTMVKQIDFVPVVPYDGIFDDDRKSLWAIYDADFYRNKFRDTLKDKFVNFADALKAKTEAINHSEYETTEGLNKVAETAAIQQIEVQMSTMETVPVEIAFNPLKEVWVIEMEATPELMVKIDTAFLLMKGYQNVTRVKDLWKITQDQKAAYLCKCKKDDIKLQFEGITFTKKDKL